MYLRGSSMGNDTYAEQSISLPYGSLWELTAFASRIGQFPPYEINHK